MIIGTYCLFDTHFSQPAMADSPPMGGIFVAYYPIGAISSR
ncbi:hypothetical protein BLGI_3477 [Brevibacillus laterosporus GI-9]|nr:hypothetical protein BLGI_3477 [Brevibacillus laterosporus GI-9]